jgi:hypothetical protein
VSIHGTGVRTAPNGAVRARLDAIHVEGADMLMTHTVAEAIQAERRAALTQAAYQNRVRLLAERRAERLPRRRLVIWWRLVHPRLLVRATKA